MNIRDYRVVAALFLLVTGLFITILYGNHIQSKTGLANRNTSIVGDSKVKIVEQMNQIMADIERIETTEGMAGKGGYVVYPARTTSRLLALYQDLEVRLSYLNSGKMPLNRARWDGFLFTGGKTQSYSPDHVMKVMTELQTNGVPGNLLNGFRIFLLPYSIPDVSGLGGAGFALISAPDWLETNSNPEAELAVTLIHETGHHIHMSIMPKGTPSGEKYWLQYLKLRGGEWHGPGPVNSVEWSHSSEETFAEDFRMLFGQDQPYFGDIALGDPRTDPEQAADIKRFMIQLAQQKPMVEYCSPWLPADMNLVFWTRQNIMIPMMWACLGVAGFIMSRHEMQKSQPIEPWPMFL